MRINLKYDSSHGAEIVLLHNVRAPIPFLEFQLTLEANLFFINN